MIDESISDLMAVEKYLDWIDEHVTLDNGIPVCSLSSIARQNIVGRVDIKFRYMTISGRVLFDVMTCADVSLRRKIDIVTKERFEWRGA